MVSDVPLCPYHRDAQASQDEVGMRMCHWCWRAAFSNQLACIYHLKGKGWVFYDDEPENGLMAFQEEVLT